MHLSYQDITSRIDEDPSWYDGNGVPRYDPFEPHDTGVYVKYALLVEISCQQCSRLFLVGEGYDTYDWCADEPRHVTLEEIATKYHYGDPPSHGCIGDTMNCGDLRIVEAWDRTFKPEGHPKNWLNWTRRPEIEAINIRSSWLDDDEHL